jgi:hypothetical protein
MDEKEKNALLQRILMVSSDAKSARIAAKTYINRGKPEDALKFIEYLDTTDPSIRKMARYILGQMGCSEALGPLLEALKQAVGGLTFLPDEEYKETHFFVNLIEILESLYGIFRANKIKDEDLRQNLLDIFKKTRHEDLRFSLIKVIAILGETAEYFLSIFTDLSHKEKRALYHVYSFTESPRRMDLYRLGLEDAFNYEFVIPNMMEFSEGRKALIDFVPQTGEKQKIFFLTILLERDQIEYLDVLIDFLDDENRQVVQLASDNIKAIDFKPFPLDRFLEKIKNGYSFEMMKAVVSIFVHFVLDKCEEYLLESLVVQPLFNNKAIILDAILKVMKNKRDIASEFSKNILKVLLEYFKTHSEDRLDFMQSVLRVIPGLTYTQSVQVRGVKKELMIFLKHHENQLHQTLLNNIQECTVRLNQLITRFEESEEKIKHIEVLFDLEVLAIDALRLERLKVQIGEVSEFTPDFLHRFVPFLVKLLDEASDWKVRSIAAELLAEHGFPDTLPDLKKKQSSDPSLGVRVAAAKALDRIQARFDIATPSALLIEPLFYISKLINDALEENGYEITLQKEWPEAEIWEKNPYTMIWVAEQFLDEENEDRLEYLKKQLEKKTKKVIIVTASPEKYAKHRVLTGLKLLKKPFTKEQLNHYFTGMG